MKFRPRTDSARRGRPRSFGFRCRSRQPRCRAGRVRLGTRDARQPSGSEPSVLSATHDASRRNNENTRSTLDDVLGRTSSDVIAQLRADGKWVASHLSSVPAPVARRYLPAPPPTPSPRRWPPSAQDASPLPRAPARASRLAPAVETTYATVSYASVGKETWVRGAGRQMFLDTQVGTHLARTFLHPPRRPHHRTPEDFGLVSSATVLTCPDGTAIHSWLVLAQLADATDATADGGPIPLAEAFARGTVILGHGIGLTKSASLRQARLVHDLGFNALLFDHRNHGKSGEYKHFDHLAAAYSQDVETCV